MAAPTRNAGRKPRYNCLFCDRGITRTDLWKVDVYPRLQHQDLSADTFRCCTSCSRSFFHTALERLTAQGKIGTVCEGCAMSFFALRDEKLAKMPRKRLDDMPDETEGALMMDDPDYDVHVMPNGSLDWHWFHRRRRLMAERRETGLCVDCG